MASVQASSGLYTGFSGGFSNDIRKQRPRTWHKRTRRMRRLGRFAARVVALAAITAVILKGAVVEAYFVPSGSMAPTLRPQDHILVEKLRYGLHAPFMNDTLIPWSRPARGDIVVFNQSAAQPHSTDEAPRTLVKRVIGVEGDTVEIVGNTVSVNGDVLVEPYAEWGSYRQPQSQRFSVPKGSIFVLGDNRADSFDSRYWRNPYVAVEHVVGRAAVVYWRGETRHS